MIGRYSERTGRLYGGVSVRCGSPIDGSTTMVFDIGARTAVESYGMRGTRTRPSDLVDCHVRRINGTLYDFSRIRWADGSVTVKVTPLNRTDILHRWDWQADGTPLIVSPYGAETLGFSLD